MDTSKHTDSSSVYTVSQVAERLALSRARFYQLLDLGVFPPPVYCCRSRRPLYTADLLAQCHTVRTTGVGINGQLLRFNAKRKRKRSEPNPVPKKLTTILTQLGLSVKPGQVSKAIQQLRIKIPDEKAIDGGAIRKLFNHLNKERQKGV